ncbi:DUF84 family protein [Evansella sp. AB-rgal1]|uniref:DUF84 family protein n=1 Tax=Evansella sp. AB-rgal1 TaxID=3242696 RepID=UPI00359DBFEE
MFSTLHIGSKNPAKIRAVEHVFSKNIEIIAKDVPSSVSPQPLSDQETKIGAVNRAKYLVEECGASLAIGLEGGVVEEKDGMLLCNWGAMVTNNNEIFVAGGARIYLPIELAESVRSGTELGEAIDDWVKKEGVRKGEGTVGILTDGVITRDQMFEHVVRLLYGQWKFSQKRRG